jgi:hypothetical protein
MSIGVQIDIQDTAGPAVRRVLEGLGPGRLNPVIGRAAQNHVRDHLFRLNTERPNRLGGRRTNFYAAAARGTQFTTVAEGVLVSVNKLGIRQRFQGGEIKPTGGRKFLTIPAIAEAHGRRAGEFNNLRFAMPGGKPALVEADATLVKRTKKGFKGTTSVGGKIIFWLRRSVTQQPDPTVLPSPEALGAAVNRAAGDHAARLLQRTGGAA